MHPLTELIHFQLKYCERCAALWLRPQNADTPYCPVCEQFMSELPMRARPARSGAVRKPMSAMAAVAFAVLAELLAGCVA